LSVRPGIFAAIKDHLPNKRQKAKSANTTHSQVSLFQNKNSCKYTNPKEKRKHKTSALKANMYVCAEWQSAKIAIVHYNKNYRTFHDVISQ
jgi:hypothetical protein